MNYTLDADGYLSTINGVAIPLCTDRLINYHSWDEVNMGHFTQLVRLLTPGPNGTWDLDGYDTYLPTYIKKESAINLLEGYRMLRVVNSLRSLTTLDGSVIDDVVSAMANSAYRVRMSPDVVAIAVVGTRFIDIRQLKKGVWLIDHATYAFIDKTLNTYINIPLHHREIYNGNLAS